MRQLAEQLAQEAIRQAGDAIAELGGELSEAVSDGICDALGMAIYGAAEGTAVAGNYGGRVSAGGGLDTETGRIFAFYTAGGNLDPMDDSTIVGLQAGLGAGGGVAESVDFMVGESYVVDVDGFVVSGSVASNSPRIDPVTGAYQGGTGSDITPRQGSVSGGPGVGASQARTSGAAVMGPQVAPGYCAEED